MEKSFSTKILDFDPDKGKMFDVFSKNCNKVDLVDYYPENYNQLV